MDASEAGDIAVFLERMTAARRAVSLARIEALYLEAKQMAAELPEHLRSRIASGLFEIALAHDLVEVHGTDFVQGIIAQGFVDGRR
jgi:hypothetical protein